MQIKVVGYKCQQKTVYIQRAVVKLGGYDILVHDSHVIPGLKKQAINKLTDMVLGSAVESAVKS